MKKNDSNKNLAAAAKTFIRMKAIWACLDSIYCPDNGNGGFFFTGHARKFSTRILMRGSYVKA